MCCLPVGTPLSDRINYQTAPPADAHNDIEDAAGFRNETHVVVWFKRRLRTGDPLDKDISPTAGKRARHGSLFEPFAFWARSSALPSDDVSDLASFSCPVSGSVSHFARPPCGHG